MAYFTASLQRIPKITSSPLFDQRQPDRRRGSNIIGFIMAYAALEARQIESGCQLLAQAADQFRSR
ncbi:hypothetical protein [Bradyrhizobium sp. NBAIM01]|uniref:hypothetical protein n=1 Tax=Bradyrhizobium sp. NBAIM01 TaxID=2793818 RepID=UPI001CD2BDAB|nr:hypothetical protein [Bradyrhizobium sp. NBAIM01]MCA1510183.1 hypothetical protein [Bradyrhizobium sp. NBAIM01]